MYICIWTDRYVREEEEGERGGEGGRERERERGRGGRERKGRQNYSSHMSVFNN